MARVIGTAGRSAAIEAIASLVILPLLVGVGVAFAVGLTFSLAKTPLHLTAGLLGGALTAWFFRTDYVQMWRDFRAGRSWWKGAEGEHRVGAELAKLPDGFVVFNDFRFRCGEEEWPDWNIDHVVVGPTGVFVIETKNYSRKDVRPAERSEYTTRNIKAVRRCAMDLKKKLIHWSANDLEGVFVEGWLVYAQQGAKIEKQYEGQTHVMPLKYLVSDIQGRSKEDIDEEQQFRVAFTLWNQLSGERRMQFAEEWALVARDHGVRRTERLQQLRAERARKKLHPLPRECPECGAELVVRTTIYGPKKGGHFLGCANYPKTGCHFTCDLDEPAA